LAEKTAVIFAADHGSFVCGHRMMDKGPAMYDDIYRVPLIVRASGLAKPGTRDELVSLVDLTPTFFDLCGVTTPDRLDGRSLVPLLRGDGTEWRDEVFAEFHGHHFPYPQRMIRTHAHKLVVNPPDVNELYDLETDPHELRNVIGDPAYRDIRDSLMRLLYEHLRASGDNFYHWMTTTFDVGGIDYDTLLGSF
jgi:arylsulfatase A-like enzyme